MDRFRNTTATGVTTQHWKLDELDNLNSSRVLSLSAWEQKRALWTQFVPSVKSWLTLVLI